MIIERLSASQKKFLVESAKRYHLSLRGSAAEEYLATRGLTSPGVREGVEQFRLGYVAEPSAGHEMYRGFLSIPYLRESADEKISVVSIRFRCLLDHEHRGHGKYMQTAGSESWLYNTRALIRHSPVVAITEGEIDAVTAQLSGVPAVGVPGATTWKPYFRELFVGYEVVYVLADGDEAGATFSRQVASSLPNSRVIPCPPGLDVNSLVVSQGKQALLSRMA